MKGSEVLTFNCYLQFFGWPTSYFVSGLTGVIFIFFTDLYHGDQKLPPGTVHRCIPPLHRECWWRVTICSACKSHRCSLDYRITRSSNRESCKSRLICENAHCDNTLHDIIIIIIIIIITIITIIMMTMTMMMMMMIVIKFNQGTQLAKMVFREALRRFFTIANFNLSRACSTKRKIIHSSYIHSFTLQFKPDKRSFLFCKLM